ncbi:hypothetical protein GOP47_0019362 [Adiantum capillus-veneris]|uniref:Uncharacterized protein n=1 Tax=Adiantum capillus-veneris TaxID=13818 RepID=A0A9D4UBB8_ADICA|nr:hypothetical protein GOP47_0019362 [Adiantum capillus-veneris]
MLTSTRRLPSSVKPVYTEAMEEIPIEHGPMLDDGATKEHPQGYNSRKGKPLEEGKIPKEDEAPPSQGRRKDRIKEKHTKR